METDKGTDAARPCHWCSRPGVTHRCVVFKNKVEACAYCKVTSKAKCTATSNPESSLEERIAQLERHVAGLNAGVAEARQELDSHHQELGNQQQQLEAAISDIDTIWKALGLDPEARSRRLSQGLGVSENEADTKGMEE